jgi:hypothetical protein
VDEALPPITSRPCPIPPTMSLSTGNGSWYHNRVQNILYRVLHWATLFSPD